MLLVARLIFMLGLLSFATTALAKDVHILVIGDSAAANCNAQSFGPVPGVYQVGRDGREKLAADPLDLGDCQGGSIWIPLGEAMVRAGFAQKVVFVPLGVTGAKVGDWLQPGRASGRLGGAIKAASLRGVEFDYAIWQQSESGNTLTGEQYRASLNRVVKIVSVNAKVKKWIIAQGAHCDGTTGGAIEDAQHRYAGNPIFNRFPGPHTSALGAAYRATGCVFNARGQQKMAELWFDSIKKADVNSDRYQKESLLYYFR